MKPKREAYSDVARGGTQGHRAEVPHNWQGQSQRPGPGGIGGSGGTGEGTKFPKPLIFLDDDSKSAFPSITGAYFCSRFKLGEEIQRLLEKNGFDEADGLLYADEFDLKDAGFQFGHIAELKWALKKIALETLGRIEDLKERARRVYIAGGEGGAGGYGDQRGGVGGPGGAPEFDQDLGFFVRRFSAIAGGVGGTGGASSGSGAYGRGENFGTNDSHQAATSNATMDESDPGVDPLLRGGIGGAGGWGDITGGVGGLGEAAELAIQQVDFFGKIVGGLGGAGGAAINFGGDGGRGKGNKFSGPLLSIDNETRRRFPTKVLKDFEIKPQHRQLLQKQGFQTAGGLFEVSKNDLLELHFKIGDISQLTVALNKLVANSKRLKA